MGMYDSVIVKCPTCSKEAELQSKSGECLMNRYTLADAPADVLIGVNFCSPSLCSDCGTWFSIDVDGTPKAVPERWHGYCEKFPDEIELGAFLSVMQGLQAVRTVAIRQQVSCR